MVGAHFPTMIASTVGAQDVDKLNKYNFCYATSRLKPDPLAALKLFQ